MDRRDRFIHLVRFLTTPALVCLFLTLGATSFAQTHKLIETVKPQTGVPPVFSRLELEDVPDAIFHTLYEPFVFERQVDAVTDKELSVSASSIPPGGWGLYAVNAFDQVNSEGPAPPLVEVGLFAVGPNQAAAFAAWRSNRVYARVSQFFGSRFFSFDALSSHTLWVGRNKDGSLIRARGPSLVGPGGEPMPVEAFDRIARDLAGKSPIENGNPSDSKNSRLAPFSRIKARLQTLRAPAAASRPSNLKNGGNGGRPVDRTPARIEPRAKSTETRSEPKAAEPKSPDTTRQPQNKPSKSDDVTIGPLGMATYTSSVPIALSFSSLPGDASPAKRSLTSTQDRLEFAAAAAFVGAMATLVGWRMKKVAVLLLIVCAFIVGVATSDTVMSRLGSGVGAPILRPQIAPVLNQEGVTTIQSGIDISAPEWAGDLTGRAWIDFNGDGYPDFCRVVTRGGKPQIAVTYSTGPRLEDRGAGPTILSQVVDAGYPNERFWADFDGDGKADFIRVVGPPGYTFRVLLSSGNGFGQDFLIKELQDLVVDDGRLLGPSDTRVWADVNGDGKADFIRLDSQRQNILVSLSTGKGLGPLRREPLF